MDEGTETQTEKGISLARGPALILGTILLAAGLYFLYKQHQFPPFSNLPNGRAPVNGDVFLGIFGANGWTGMLTAVGGGLLLFGAAQHLLAKTMSLIVGVALAAAAIIAVVSGNVLGMAAANGWTELGWAVVAAILLFNTMVPRRRRTVVAAAGEGPVRRRRATAVPAGGAAAGGAAAGAGVAGGVAGERDRVVEPRRGEQPVVADHGVADRTAADDRGAAPVEPSGSRGEEPAREAAVEPGAAPGGEPVREAGVEPGVTPPVEPARQSRIGGEDPAIRSDS